MQIKINLICLKLYYLLVNLKEKEPILKRQPTIESRKGSGYSALVEQYL